MSTDHLYEEKKWATKADEKAAQRSAQQAIKKWLKQCDEIYAREKLLAKNQRRQK